MRFGQLVPRAALVITFVSMVKALGAQTIPLEPGKPVSGELQAGQTRSYSIPLDAKWYIRAVISQPAPAVLVELYTPDGNKAGEVDTRNFRSKPSRMIGIADTTGAYRMVVSLPAQSAGVTHYEIKLEERRLATADDRKQVEAERWFMRGLGEARAFTLDKAIVSDTRAFELYREAHDREREADALTAAGAAYMDTGQSRKAIALDDQALAIRREIRDRGGEGGALNELGIAYFYLSDNDKAIGYWEQALAIHRETGSRQFEILTLVNLGAAYHRLSQFEKAIGSYEQALPMIRELKNREVEGNALTNLGVAYSALNQYERAIGHFEQSLAIDREIHNRRGEAVDLLTLGNAYRMLFAYEKAIAYFEQALPIFREIKDGNDEGRALNNLGAAYESMGQSGKAVPYYEQALAMARETADRGSEGIALVNLGTAYRSIQQFEKAIGLYEQALAISREVKDRNTETAELRALMEIWQISGSPRLAIFYGKQAVNLIQGIRGDIRGLSQDLRQSFLEGNRVSYRNLTDILVTQGRLIEAQQALALLKGQEFYDYAATELGGAIGMTREEADWAERYRKGDSLAEKSAAIGELQDRIQKQAPAAESAETQRQMAGLEADLETGNRSFQKLLGDLKRHFQTAPEAASDTIDLKTTEALRADLAELKHGAVAIYTLVTAERYVAILVTPNGQKDYGSKIKSADLNQKILAFREAMEDPQSDPRRLAQELYNILIPGALANALSQAKAETLMWSLDGPLRYLPVAALHDGKRYLIEKYRMAVLTPASNARLKDAPQPKWRGVAFGVSEAHTGFSPLPAVADELRGIVREKPGEPGVLEGRRLLDQKFTRASLDRELKSGYTVVHVASHFQFSPGDDQRSFLLLGDGSRLTLADIKSAGAMFDGVDLLTLSACSTGLGDVKMPDGSEVEGFGVLAQREGAKAVVASLWPVADASTGLLMREFYRIHQSDPKLTKIEALRRAQLHLLDGKINSGGAGEARGVRVAGEAARGRDYRHPYYWAPFFLMGNWL
jgi:CHAT domain-containing protein/Tfp pilus assembly protein PilF